MVNMLDLAKPLISSNGTTHTLVTYCDYCVITEYYHTGKRELFMWDRYGNLYPDQWVDDNNAKLLNVPVKTFEQLVIGNILIYEDRLVFPISYINDELIISSVSGSNATYLINKDLVLMGYFSNLDQPYTDGNYILTSSRFGGKQLKIKQ